MQASITTLDQYAPNYMVHVDKSTTTGALSIDLVYSDTGGQYAYVNDTYIARLVLADISNGSIDRIRIVATCRNASGTGFTVYDASRVDYVLLDPGEKVTRTVGFKVGQDTPQGIYTFRVDVYADPSGNDSWSAYGCGFEAGLNILRAPG